MGWDVCSGSLTDIEARLRTATADTLFDHLIGAANSAREAVWPVGCGASGGGAAMIASKPDHTRLSSVALITQGGDLRAVCRAQ